MEGATPPLIASAFLKKIVASHYIKVIDYFEIIVQRLKRVSFFFIPSIIRFHNIAMVNTQHRQKDYSPVKPTRKTTTPGQNNGNNGPAYNSPIASSQNTLPTSNPSFKP